VFVLKVQTLFSFVLSNKNKIFLCEKKYLKRAKYDGVHLKPIFELKWQTSANQLVMRTTDSSGVSTNLLIDNLEVILSFENS